jgi:hypothetical protein
MCTEHASWRVWQSSWEIFPAENGSVPARYAISALCRGIVLFRGEKMGELIRICL